MSLVIGIQSQDFHLSIIHFLYPELGVTGAADHRATARDEMLKHAFIISRLDYCSRLLSRLPSTQLQKSICTQNSGTLSTKYPFQTPFLTFKPLRNLVHPDLSNLLQQHRPTVHLHSADLNCLMPTRLNSIQTVLMAATLIPFLGVAVLTR